MILSFTRFFIGVLLWQTADFSTVRSISSSQHVFRSETIIYFLVKFSNILLRPTTRDIPSVLTHNIFRFERNEGSFVQFCLVKSES
jgi:hypothetical protein